MREIINLNFGWRFSPDFKPEYTRTDFIDNTFKLVDLPHVISETPTNYASEKPFQRVSCYRKMFILPKELYGRRLILHFDGVMGCAAVCVNGKPVCAHRGGFTPFSCDVTGEISEYLNSGDNLITVAVDSTERDDTAPYGGTVDQLYYGGMYREVWLEAVDEMRVTRFSAFPRKVDGEWVVDIDGELSLKDSAEVRMYLCDGESKLAVKYLLASGGCFGYRLPVQNVVQQWTEQTPRLYKVVITVNESDEVSCNIGFREAEFRSDGFYLNGEKRLLVGLSRGQNYPYVGSALPAYAQRHDADLLKELGCNFVRTWGCPPSKHFLDRCDEIGLMVFDEIPGRGYVGGAGWQESLLENMEELIVRDRNHPSVILWGTRVEESPESPELYEKTLALAKRLDGRRSTTGVRSTPYIAPIPEDVFTYNDYVHTGDNIPLERKKNIVKAKLPYLVSGHTGFRWPARSYDSETVRLEHALRHTRALDAAYGESELCGVVGCCLSDYSTQSRWGGADNICAYGVTDQYRVKKLAAYVYESQQDEHFVMEISSALCGGDNPNCALGKAYVFTNCDYVRLTRNGSEVGKFYPAEKLFPNLPHPPVVVDDFIGDLLVTEEKLEAKDAAAVKNALVAIARDGETPSDSRLRAASAMSRYKLSPEEFCRLYDKYFAGRFGGARLVFEGVKGGKTVRTIVSEPVHEAELRAECERTELVSDATYDCARIQLTAVDQNGNRLYSCFNACSVECEGSVEVIGPRIFTLQGGAAAFYVRTKGGKGAAKVKVTTESLGACIVELNIKRLLPGGKKTDGK